MNIKEIIFDLDGTLWDSTDVVLKAWNDMLSGIKEVQNPLTKEELQSIMGLQLEEIGPVLFPYLDDEFRIGLMKKCCVMEQQWIRKQGGNLFNDLEEILKMLSQKYKLFIVSNCDCGYIESFLEYHHELKSYFIDFECAGNTGLSKGENIDRIIQKHKLKNPIYVGDTQGDCDAAKIANIPFVFASYGFGKVSSYDYKLEQISDLVNYSPLTSLKWELLGQ
nr:HAD family hydrolase [Clostridium tepidiprofundi]